MKSIPRLGVCLLSAALSFTVVDSARADAVTDWNLAATTAAAAPFVGGIPQGRIFAMTHAAIHDALNAIDRRYQPYAFDLRADPNASPDAAVAAAAHDVLVHEIPSVQQPMLDTAYADSLSGIPDGAAKHAGIAIGQAAAAAIIALREFGWLAGFNALHAGKRTRRVDPDAARLSPRGRSRVGEGDAVRAAQRGAVSAQAARIL